MKPLAESKKTLEGEKNLWLAEKTALKSEVFSFFLMYILFCIAALCTAMSVFFFNFLTN